MTTITLPRAVVEQALEALEDAKALLNNKDRTTTMWFADEITALRAALAQQAEPVEPVALIDPTRGFVRWSTETTPPEVVASYKRAGWTPITPHQPQIEDRLARHGIPMPGDPK